MCIKVDTKIKISGFKKQFNINILAFNIDIPPNPKGALLHRAITVSREEVQVRQIMQNSPLKSDV